MKIAISGKMLSGKSYLADEICKQYPGFRKTSIAKSLKEMVKDNFGVDKTHKNGREILQMYGKIGRLVDPLFWIKNLIEETSKYYMYSHVIDDLRFKNEAEQLRKNGYLLVRVESSLSSRLARGKLEHNKDISETDLDDYEFDIVINNDGEFNHDEVFQKIMSFEVK